jgi:DNA topoisomerase-1
MEPDKIKDSLSQDQYKLYKLIWERFIISQLAPVEYEQFTILADYDKYEFRGVVNKVTFDGYYKVFKEEDEIVTGDFPEIKEGDQLKLNNLDIKEGITKPPARLTESSLVKKLEAEGIGRPSTYATIIDTLKKREYVVLEGKSFVPSELGYEVKEKLSKYFPKIMNVKFTAEMEEKLDNIEEGELEWVAVLKEFYDDLKGYLESFEKEVEELKNRRIESDVICPVEGCGHVMLLKTGRFGKYLECDDYENCKGRISLKGVNISKEEIEKGKIYIKEVIEEKEKERRGNETDVFTDTGSRLYLKWGRFGQYLESENYAEDNIRLSLPSEVKKLLKEEKIQEENDIILLKDVLEQIKEEEDEILRNAGVCEKCGKPFEIKRGRWGKFLACTGYPECKNIKKIEKSKK